MLHIWMQVSCLVVLVLLLSVLLPSSVPLLLQSAPVQFVELSV